MVTRLATSPSKTGLDISYVNGIMKLLNKGEERLLQAVEKQQDSAQCGSHDRQFQ